MSTTLTPSHLLIALAIQATLVQTTASAADPARPNVLVIIVDDMGYGDLGFHGNPKIRTPYIDALARQSVQVQHFYVSPVCAPTRASLMTGRYNYRTGVVDTALGRALMYPDEVTLAEMLGAAGYRTGIFGKWHLGDNYPLRAIDQGFQEALVLKGGGIGQPSDPPGGSSYFDPLLLHNGKLVKTKGYCSDVFTDATIRFIDPPSPHHPRGGKEEGRPFFAYLAFNAPHTPLQVPDAYHEPYKKMNLKAADFPALGQPIGAKFDPDITAKIYGMVTNIDDNLGRLFAKLDELKLAENTIVVFLTDNGPQQPRFTAGLRDRKGSVYEGGIHVPCFVRWPARLQAGRKVEPIAAHIDVAPTILEACGVSKPQSVQFDGRSLFPLLKGEPVAMQERTLYFQWHRGDVPELYRACAARTQRWKLVQPLGTGATKFAGKPRFELYDLAADPFEQNDLAGRHPEIVDKMRRGYEDWYKDVSATRGYDPPRIYLGTSHENPVILTRQDWRGPRAGWAPGDVGHWEVQVAEAGNYAVTVRFDPAGDGATVGLSLGKLVLANSIVKGEAEATWRTQLPAGPGRLEAWVGGKGARTGVRFAEIKRLE